MQSLAHRAAGSACSARPATFNSLVRTESPTFPGASTTPTFPDPRFFQRRISAVWRTKGKGPESRTSICPFSTELQGERDLEGKAAGSRFGLRERRIDRCSIPARHRRVGPRSLQLAQVAVAPARAARTARCGRRSLAPVSRRLLRFRHRFRCHRACRRPGGGRRTIPGPSAARPGRATAGVSRGARSRAGARRLGSSWTFQTEDSRSISGTV